MASPKSTPLIGHWGGDRLNLELTDKGGTMTLDCASGTIAHPVHADASGHFESKAEWRQYSPGPDQGDDRLASEPAMIQGHISGPTLHLTVSHKGGLQRFTLDQGKRAKLVRCL